MYEDSCGCRKFNISDDVVATGAESLCSRYSTWRGPGQKVISFALYGKAVIELVKFNTYSQLLAYGRRKSCRIQYRLLY